MNHPLSDKLIMLGSSIKELTDEYGEDRVYCGEYAGLSSEIEAAKRELDNLPEYQARQVREEVKQQLNWIIEEPK